MLNPFLVTNRHSDKTLGAVYAASIQSAREIANILWMNDKDALSLLNLREKFEGLQTGKAVLCAVAEQE